VFARRQRQSQAKPEQSNPQMTQIETEQRRLERIQAIKDDSAAVTRSLQIHAD